MIWQQTNRADPVAASLADRHYTRQSVGARQFVPPGRCLVLLTPDASALWVSSWPKAEYVHHAWAGAWMCSLFRNEAPDRYLSSNLIKEAVAQTCTTWGKPPKQGFVTFVDIAKVRQKRNPGYCYECAGWQPVGTTQGGLLALQLLPARMASILALCGLPSFAFRDMLPCLACGKQVEQKEKGRIKRHCNETCRQRAHRLRETASLEGGAL